jgi:hypothetical protein
VFGAPPQNPKKIVLPLCSSNIPILGIQKQLFWLMGRHPGTHTIVLGIVHFTHPNSRYPKTPFLAYRAQSYGCLGRQPRTRTKVFALVQFKHSHPRYPKTPLLAYRAQRYGVWGAPPEPKQYLLPLCSSNIPILGIQKHLFWPMGCRGMGVWGAMDPTQSFWELCSSHTPILGIQKHLC